MDSFPHKWMQSQNRFRTHVLWFLTFFPDKPHHANQSTQNRKNFSSAGAFPTYTVVHLQLSRMSTRVGFIFQGSESVGFRVLSLGFGAGGFI